MPITRTTLLAGPAAATFGGHTFFAHDGILITPALEVAAVDSDAQGVLDATTTGAPVTIRFTPSAGFADLVALYPHTQGSPGSSLFGSVDAPLVLTGSNGVRLTFAAVAITAMPDLHLTSRGPVTGAVTFLAKGARSLPVTAANRLVTIDTATIPAAPLGTPQLADDFAITLGAVPWLNLRARDGVRIHFAMKTKPVLSDANLLLDVTLERLQVEARFAPASPGGPAEVDVVAGLQLQGANALPGRLLGATGNALQIAGQHLWVELPLAQMMAGALAFDAMHPRVGELVFVAPRAQLGSSGLAALVTLSEGEI